MRNPTLLALSLLATTACTGNNDAVWLFILSEPSLSMSESCTENFINANCPEGETTEPSPWTQTFSRELSDEALFGQIMDGPGGTKLLVIDNEVYVGEREDGIWNFRWEYFDIQEETLSHQSGYTFGLTSQELVEVVYSLDLSGGEAEGSLNIIGEEIYEIWESDSWNADQVGFGWGNISGTSEVFLEGDFDNESDVNDCSDAQCRITRVREYEVRHPVSGLRTRDDGRSFDGVRNAGQDNRF
ncbi:MAG: hypothetical protein EA397_05350 [Deltaproteobacteria bacterium]|nr:MAG: hypothetical protein EA397_05350 [Deltaproteobacteria bacterium]